MIIIMFFAFMSVFFSACMHTSRCKYSLTCLCLVSPVQEVDGVAPVVLNVPAEGGETHPHIEPGHLHTRDVYVDVGEHGLLQHGHVIQIPS